MPFGSCLLKEPFTNQQVYPLNWDEHEGWVEVYVNGERTKFAIQDLRTLDGQPVQFPEPAIVVDTQQVSVNKPSF